MTIPTNVLSDHLAPAKAALERAKKARDKARECFYDAQAAVEKAKNAVQEARRAGLAHMSDSELWEWFMFDLPHEQVIRPEVLRELDERKIFVQGAYEQVFTCPGCGKVSRSLPGVPMALEHTKECPIHGDLARRKRWLRQEPGALPCPKCGQHEMRQLAEYSGWRCAECDTAVGCKVYLANRKHGFWSEEYLKAFHER